MRHKSVNMLLISEYLINNSFGCILTFSYAASYADACLEKLPLKSC